MCEPRRGRDSNPREAHHLCSLSKRVHSTALTTSPQSTGSIGGPVCFERRSARYACCASPSGKAVGAPTASVVALLVATLLVGAAPRRPPARQAVAGVSTCRARSYRVPSRRQPRRTRLQTADSRAEPSTAAGSSAATRQPTCCLPILIAARFRRVFGSPQRKRRAARKLGRLPARDDSARRIAYRRALQLSNEESAALAYQEADLLDDRGNLVVNLSGPSTISPFGCAGSGISAAYGGRTLWLYFGVHGDGYPNRSTQQYVDDVTLTSASSLRREIGPLYLQREEKRHAIAGSTTGTRTPRRSRRAATRADTLLDRPGSRHRRAWRDGRVRLAAHCRPRNAAKTPRRSGFKS